MKMGRPTSNPIDEEVVTENCKVGNGRYRILHGKTLDNPNWCGIKREKYR